MTTAFDLLAIGNAIVDVISPCDDAFLARHGLTKSSMMLVDESQSETLYQSMAKGLETSGGSAANTVAGAASFGIRTAFVGKVANDALGLSFDQGMRDGGVHFRMMPLVGGPATARSLINVTPDGQRTMSTFLGASTWLTPADIDADEIARAGVIYLEGYLFDATEARKAFQKASEIARAHDRKMALTLSDGFVVERHRADLIAFLKSDIDIVFANEAEVCALFEGDDVYQAAKALSDIVGTVAVTRGAKGAWATNGTETVEVPALLLGEVVDTTGAGDQFAAGFLTGLTRNLPLQSACRLGVMAAGEVISHYGPRPDTSLLALAGSQGLI